MSEKDFIKNLPHPAFLHKADGTRLTKKELRKFLKSFRKFYDKSEVYRSILKAKRELRPDVLLTHEEVFGKKEGG